MDTFEQIFYDDFYRSHSDKSDSELRDIVLNNARKVAAMPLQPSAQMMAEAKKMVAESKACNAILTERQEKREALESAIENWKAEKESRAKDLILNLPAAVSSNGQLIAAILEEEKLTADEIAGWCDELAMLDRAELDSLLEELVLEQIIALNGDRYECINICTPSLYPEKPVEWGLAKINEYIADGNYAPDRLLERAKLLLTAFSIADAPYSVDSLSAELRHFSFLVHQGECLEEDINMDKSDLEEILSLMSRNKILDRFYLGGTSVYYLKQLGKVLRRAPAANIEASLRSLDENKSDEPLTEQQKQNIEYKKIILNAIAASGEPMTITDIHDSDPRLSNLSNQRVSALTRQLMSEGYIARIEDARKAYFIYVNKE